MNPHTDDAPQSLVAAVVLAAGISRRMGRSKLTLPWGCTTVIGQVVATLSRAGLPEIVVVTGGAQPQVSAALSDSPARIVFNPRWQEDYMLFSLQAGLSALSNAACATLVALGDQPLIQVSVIQALLAAYHLTHKPLIMPSYQLRRGHPWLLDRSLWQDILSIREGKNMRSVWQAYADQIEYVLVDTESILLDLDLPADYERLKPADTPG